MADSTVASAQKWLLILQRCRMKNSFGYSVEKLPARLAEHLMRASEKKFTSLAQIRGKVRITALSCYSQGF